MELKQAAELAISIMADNGLFRNGWDFDWDNAVNRFGQANFSKKKITLSRKVVALNGEAEVLETIRHEVAHAIAGFKAGHGPEWARVAKALGSTASRTHSAATPEGKYVSVCGTCGRRSDRHRLPKRSYACPDCCGKYNGGRYSEKYRLTFIAQR